MSLPRVLVVRSGRHAFPAPESGTRVELVECVSHRIEPVEVSEESLSGEPDLVIFTSQIAVDYALESPLGAAVRRCAERGRVVAVGPATEAALRRAGVAPEGRAGGFAEAVLREVPANLEGLLALLPCGEDASPELPDGLRARGARVARIVVYRKIPNAPDAGLPAEILGRPFAAFCATSPSAAGWLFSGLDARAAERLRSTPAVALGPATRRRLASLGVARVESVPIARFSSALGLLETLATAAPGK